ncbi:MAG: chemotaxis protein CheX [Brevinematia bacterium]
MRIEYINPFVESTFEIMSEILKADDIRRGELFLKKSPTITYGVSIIIGITGPASGRIIFDMDNKTALGIISHMLGSEVTNLDDIGEVEKSALGEIGNMITGSAITKLYKKGYTFVLTPPTVVVGKEYSIETPQIETLVVPVVLPFGQIEINIALKEV